MERMATPTYTMQLRNRRWPRIRASMAFSIEFAKKQSFGYWLLVALDAKAQGPSRTEMV